MRAFAECIHEVNLRELCGECVVLAELVHERPSGRLVDPIHIVQAIDRLEANQAPSSLHEALNSGDGSYRP